MKHIYLSWESGCDVDSVYFIIIWAYSSHLSGPIPSSMAKSTFPPSGQHGARKTDNFCRSFEKIVGFRFFWPLAPCGSLLKTDPLAPEKKKVGSLGPAPGPLETSSGFQKS